MNYSVPGLGVCVSQHLNTSITCCSLNWFFSLFWEKKCIIPYYNAATVCSTHKSCGHFSWWAKHFKHLFGDQEHHYSPNTRVLYHLADLVQSRKQIKSHKKSLALWDFKQKKKKKAFLIGMCVSSSTFCYAHHKFSHWLDKLTILKGSFS